MHTLLTFLLFQNKKQSKRQPPIILTPTVSYVLLPLPFLTLFLLPSAVSVSSCNCHIAGTSSSSTTAAVNASRSRCLSLCPFLRTFSQLVISGRENTGCGGSEAEAGGGWENAKETPTITSLGAMANDCHLRCKRAHFTASLRC